MLSYLLPALLLAAASDADTSQCPLDRMTAEEKAKASTDLFEGREPGGEKGALFKALMACAKKRGWNEATVAVISRGAANRLVYDKVIERFAASGMPLDTVHAWFERQPEAVQVADSITPEMVTGAATELLEAGVPRETLEAEARAIAIAIYALIELRRMQKGLPQFGS